MMTVLPQFEDYSFPLIFLLIYKNTQAETMLSHITWRSSGNYILLLISATIWEDKRFLKWKLNTFRDIYVEIVILKINYTLRELIQSIENQTIAFGFIKIFYSFF